MGTEFSFEDYIEGYFEGQTIFRKFNSTINRQIELQKKYKDDLGSDGLRQLALLLLYYGTSLSFEDICQLNIEDLSFGFDGLNNCTISVGTHSGKKRTIIVGLETAELLKRYLHSHGDRTSGTLFLDQRGRKLHPNDIVRIVDRSRNRQMHDEIGQHFSVTSRNHMSVLPTPLRLDTNPRFTGRGVTMAFLDSGFYPHPDIMQPRRRLLAYKNVAGGNKYDFEKSTNSSWHGMQTSVAAVGNGYLSGGLYRGIASDAELVLVQVAGPAGITYKTIVSGFEWVIKKKERYNIRILNVSLGTAAEQPYRLNTLDGLAEDAMQAGIVVLVAAGNDGYDPDRNIITPPASAPSVITVGGLNDQNSLNISDIVPYHSNFGKTIDGIVKPEIVAPGIWVAAPILPGSPLFQKAKLLWSFKDLDSRDLRKSVEDNVERIGLETSILDLSDQDLLKRIKDEIGREKLIAPHYQHVDGTSFSSPIVGSVIAQMLEANPALTPSVVKEILIDTAVSLPGIPRERQGYGMVNPRAAVESALRYTLKTRGVRRTISPMVGENVVTIRYTDDTCSSVSIAGSFNQWNPEDVYMKRQGPEEWVAEFTVDEPGTYFYKLIIDEHQWIADPLCFKNEFDGFGGKNSSFEIHCYSDTAKRIHDFSEQLKKNPPSLKNAPERTRVLEAFDVILKPESICRADSVRTYFHRSWSELIQRMNEPHHLPSVSLLYNMGTILCTGSMNIGFDLVSCRHVLGVYWKTEDELIESLVDFMDVLFVTHRHADHLDIEIAERMVKAGKMVVGPNEASDVLPRGVLALSENEEREIYGIGDGNGELKVRAFNGVHVRNRKTPMRVYEVTFDKNLTVVHSGDHDFNKKMISFDSSPELVIVSAEGTPAHGFGSNVRTVMIAHNGELGHTNDLGRFGFGESLAKAASWKNNSVVLTWGETLSLESFTSKV